MNTPSSPLAFDATAALAWLESVDDPTLDALAFGVIGFDTQGRVQRYNRYESQAARFEQASVLGQHVFVELAPCLNNYLVAGKFEEAHAAAQVLDETLAYVLTFRMRPTRVRMRLLSQPGATCRYILIERQGGAA